MQGNSRAGNLSEHSEIEARGRSLWHSTGQSVVFVCLPGWNVTKEFSVVGRELSPKGLS